MMIKENQLREFRPTVRYSDGENLTLQFIQEVIEEQAAKYHIPVAFYNDVVSSGGFLKNSSEECIVMHHPDHKDDYLKYCIRVNKQGTYAFVKIDLFGRSKQIKKESYAYGYKKARKGQTISNKILLSVAQGIMTLGLDKQKLEYEMNYNQMIRDLFDEIFS